MTVRRLLLSRFCIVPIAIAVAVAGWNVYVATHAHGLLTGSVVDRAGHSVAGATVILYTHDFVTQVEKTRTETDASGIFRFTDNNSHLIQLQALSGARSSHNDPVVVSGPGQGAQGAARPGAGGVSGGSDAESRRPTM